MEKVDILIRSLAPEIDMKCAEIRKRVLTKVFIAVAVLMLIIPALLIFFGISPLMIFVPIVFVGVVFLTASPVLMSKGAECYEQV